jgi:hypothetical protein
MSTNKSTDAVASKNDGVEMSIDGSPKYKTLEEAELEIARLKQELAEAHEELENLSEATSGFVRLMI